MRALPLVAILLGLAAMAALVAYFGAGAVVHSLAAVGWAGFASVCLIHVTMMALMGVAWHALLPKSSVRLLIWGRFVRDAGSEVLPLSQVGGYVLGTRALAIGGIGAARATASTIVDVTVEFIAQLTYTAIALGWLVHLRPSAEIALPTAIGLGVAAAGAAIFVLLQRHGMRFFDRSARLLGRGWADRTAAGAGALHGELEGIYRRRTGLWTSLFVHLGCWIASATEPWIALRFAGVNLPFAAVMVIESLLYATRSVAFVMPNAVGVQEAAYVLLGGTFGLTPEMALALSLVKRARDLAIGLPTIALWQVHEGGRLWRRHAAARAIVAAEKPPLQE
ncbi:MAG TPA: lysylphosphatidylglycerol synthase domain-containing protein [Stellaceae bacterium]|nr:lysylphosphatidylglycerol synthase domain-containing protein [Stellaceae bacterium]